MQGWFGAPINRLVFRLVSGWSECGDRSDISDFSTNLTPRFFSLNRFPAEGIVLQAELRDQGEELLMETSSGSSSSVPILGLLQTKNPAFAKENAKPGENEIDIHLEKIQIKSNSLSDRANDKAGRLVVYGDSNCIDDSHLQKRMYQVVRSVGLRSVESKASQSTTSSTYFKNQVQSS